jgi:hypothetical protein
LLYHEKENKKQEWQQNSLPRKTKPADRRSRSRTKFRKKLSPSLMINPCLMLNLSLMLNPSLMLNLSLMFKPKPTVLILLHLQSLARREVDPTKALVLSCNRLWE